MELYFASVARPLFMSLSGDREYGVIALAWDETENATRYLLAADERPTWVSEHDVIRTVLRDSTEPA